MERGPTEKLNNNNYKNRHRSRYIQKKLNFVVSTSVAKNDRKKLLLSNNANVKSLSTLWITTEKQYLCQTAQNKFLFDRFQKTVKPFINEK